MPARPAPDAPRRDRAALRAGTARRPGLRALAARRWSRTVAALTATSALMAGGVTAAAADPAPAESTWTHELLVDSLATTVDADPGDGVCATAAGECTLRAAIMESNALGAGPGEVRIGVHPDFAGGRIVLTATQSTWMRTTALSAGGGTITGDGGAVFDVLAPVTIDLENKITAAPNNNADLPAAAVFHLNGPDITMQRVDQSFSAETTFYVGPNASNVHITGGTIATANYYPERFVLVRGGASDVRISSYTVSGYASNDTQWGWGYVDGATATNPVRGLVVDDVTYTAGATGACGASASAGCSSSPMSLRGQTVTEFTFTNNTVVNFNRAVSASTRIMDLRSATVDRFVFANNTITTPQLRAGLPLIEFGGTAATRATVHDFEIVDNVFTGVTAATEAESGAIRLPFGGTVRDRGVIARNTFQAATGPTQAVYWQGPGANTLSVAPSNVVIEDNAFDGWGSAASRSTIRLRHTGAVTVQRNTFGTGSGSQVNTVAEEAGAVDAIVQTLVNNRNLGANGKLNTWYPTARAADNTQATLVGAERCTIDLEVAPPSGAPALAAARDPESPTTLDLYWTSGAAAEVYLESVTVTEQAPQTFTVTLPLEGDERLAHLPAGATIPVNPTTGEVAGGLRLQTQDTQAGSTTASSQFSRVALLSGTCRPELTIDQAEGQADPALTRDLHWTVTSSLPLTGLDAADVDLEAEATDLTIDAERLNPRIVAVTPVDEENTVFTVIARVDDSALLRAGIAAGAVTAESGWENDAPAVSTDAEITYVNPLVLDPEQVTLLAGDEVGESYAVSTRVGAPVPADDLAFRTLPDAVATEFDVRLANAAPTIPMGGSSTGALTVTAGESDVEAGTSALVGHEVTSTDVNYDGLVVQSLDVRLYSTSPALQLTKQAYVHVGDPSTPESIRATGTEVLAGSRLGDGQAVCFVWTVANNSRDTWATELTDVVVRDSDTRLGDGGLIAEIPALAVGESRQYASCAPLVPVDSRRA
jgi:hypothetical protein